MVIFYIHHVGVQTSNMLG